MSKLRKHKRKMLREGKDYPAKKLPYMSILNVSVIVTDKFSMLELPGLDGKIDQNTAIFGYDN